MQTVLQCCRTPRPLLSRAGYWAEPPLHKETRRQGSSRAVQKTKGSRDSKPCSV